MALSQGGYNFEALNMVHGDIVPSPWTVPIVVHRFPGVAGESHLTAPPHGRSLSCRFTLRDYASAAFVQLALDRLDDRSGTLTGDLTTTGNLTRTFRHCTFLGIAIEPEGIRYDPSTGTYRVRGTLQWAQRGRNNDDLP